MYATMYTLTHVIFSKLTKLSCPGSLSIGGVQTVVGVIEMPSSSSCSGVRRTAMESSLPLTTHPSSPISEIVNRVRFVSFSYFDLKISFDDF